MVHSALTDDPRRTRGWISLKVQDNGVGFGANGRGGREGTGIANMRERAELLGGTLHINGGTCTEVVVRIPDGETTR